MKFHQLRNATCLIETGDQVILVDPMLAGSGIANHLDVLNQCPITRSKLSAELARCGLMEKAISPASGEVLRLQ